ncbi:hypothetical protein [Aquisalimonas asiatica]|uniref:Nickel transport protein n=1 Tax=Aquisalimonas asiatica TaxID=406100 RepID=A0A1H8SY78_9GAMM|nr:hypothetical protein [Aquisalimonas asiatica]SEO83671.1 hypothetical protein SAMN04488052_103283 [Aquisalimonas asiatica]
MTDRSPLRTLAQTTLVAAGLLVASQSVAHQLWMEPTDEGLAMYYGYLDRNLREVSPGRLDEIVVPRADRITDSGSEAVAISNEGDHLALDTSPDAPVLLVFDNGQVYENERDGETVGTHWTMATRYAPQNDEPAEPRLDFDIVPTGEPGAFRVTLHGDPVDSGHTVRLSTEYGWTMDRRTEDDGVVTFPSLPWQGVYAVASRHNVAEAGTRERILADGGTETIDHDRRGFVTTLTFRKTEGREPLPPLPKSAPYEEGVRAQ